MHDEALNTSVSKAITTREFEETSEVDEELKALRKAIKTGRLAECKAYAPAVGDLYLCVIGQLVQRCTRTVLPSKLLKISSNCLDPREGH